MSHNKRKLRLNLNSLCASMKSFDLKMPRQKQIGVSGKVINAQTREVIANVLKFMKKEAIQGSPLIPITHFKQRLIEATGISDKVYRQISNDLQHIESGKQSCFTAPRRGSKSKSEFTIEIKDELLDESKELKNKDNKAFYNENGLNKW